VRTAETVVFKIVFTLQRVYKKTPQEIRDALLRIIVNERRGRDERKSDARGSGSHSPGHRQGL